MSSHGSPLLDLDVRSRRTERGIAGVSVALAMGSALLIDLSPPLVAILSTVAGVSVAAAFWRSGWIGTRYRITRICWLADGRWLLTTDRGPQFEAELSPATRRTAGFAWLRWQSPHRHSMLLGRRDVAASDLRRLLVRLGIDGLQGTLTLGLADDDKGSNSAWSRLAALAASPSGMAPAWIRRSFQAQPVARTRRP